MDRINLIDPVERLRGHTTLILFGVVILLAVAIRVVFYTGFFGSDEVIYIASALRVLENDWTISSYVGATRYGINLPLAIMMGIFGVSELSAALYSFVCSIAEIVVVWGFCLLLSGRKLAFFATLILALTPIHVHYAGRLMADSPLALFITLSFFLFWLANKRDSVLLYFLTGLSLGFTFWIKEVIAVIYPLFFLYALLYRRWDHKWWIVMFSAALMFFANCLFFYIQTGNFFYLFEVVSNAVSKYEHKQTATEPFYYFSYLFIKIYHTGIVGPLVLFGLYQWYRNRKTACANELDYVVVWFLGLLGLLSFLIAPSGDFISKQVNYMLVFLAPMAILSGYLLSTMPRFFAAALLLVVTVFGVVLSAMEQQAIVAFTSNSKATAIFAKENSENRIFASENANRIFNVQRALSDEDYPGNMFSLSDAQMAVQGAEIPGPGDYVILDTETLSWARKDRSNNSIEDIPACWEYKGTLDPIIHGQGAVVVLGVDKMLSLTLPEKLKSRFEYRLRKLQQPKPAYLYRVKYQC